MYPEYKKIIFPYSNRDGSVSWVVEYPDLPGCSAVGKTQEEALVESKTASELWLDAYYDDHHCYPDAKPMSQTFSGRIALRIPKTLHKELSEQAQLEGVSLNSLIITLLAQNFGKRLSRPTINIKEKRYRASE